MSSFPDPMCPLALVVAREDLQRAIEILHEAKLQHQSNLLGEGNCEEEPRSGEIIQASPYRKIRLSVLLVFFGLVLLALLALLCAAAPR
jgi:hypothetical protein